MASGTLVLGIGNTLLSDEGCGVQVLAYLQAHYSLSPTVSCVDGGTLGFSLAGLIAETNQLIVIDAANLGKEAGNICCFVGEEMEQFLGKTKLTAHEVGLWTVLDIARLEGYLPEKRALIGIQPLTIDWGETLSPPVAAAIPTAAALVMDLITGNYELKT